jgi:hypothetical protein
MPPVEPRAEPSRRDYSLPVVLVATVGLLLARLPLIPRRIFDPDELEHAHAAWCLFKGMLPYRDFFEHHTPWYYYMLRPFFRWFEVDTSFESARHFLLLGRGISFALTVLSVILVVRIGTLIADRRVGLLGGLLLVAQPLFLQKALEMRPDVLALLFFLAGLWCLLRGMATNVALPPRRLLYFAAGGLALGAAVMSTQKALFALPGMLVGLGVWALAPAAREEREPARSTATDSTGARLVAVLVFSSGIVLPIAATWGAFAIRNAGGPFLDNNFFLNARWKHTTTGQLFQLIKYSWPVLALSVVGLAAAVLRFFRSGSPDHRELLLACTVVGLFAGVLVIPVAQRQYYLLPLPIVCFFAARGLLALVDRGPAHTRARRLVLWLIPLSILPGIGLYFSFTSPNDRQLARLERVFATTKPTDLVMDGWEGMGVFRPHAFYYFFVHDEILPMLRQDRVTAYLNDLEAGNVRPKLIALDKHLAALGPRFMALVKLNYVSDDGFLYVSKN